MTTEKQKKAAKANIKKAQAKWKSMTKRQHSLAQPQGRARSKPGTTGEGKYYRIEVRSKYLFKTFRTQDVGEPGHLQRLTGKRANGKWATHAWLISKEDADVKNGTLVAKKSDVRDLLKNLGSKPVHVKGDIFKAKDHPNVPEKDKPTLAQKRARSLNIKKAQKAR